MSDRIGLCVNDISGTNVHHPFVLLDAEAATYRLCVEPDALTEPR